VTEHSVTKRETCINDVLSQDSNQVKRLLHLDLAPFDDGSVHCKPSRLGISATCKRYKAKALHAEKQTDRQTDMQRALNHMQRTLSLNNMQHQLQLQTSTNQPPLF